MAELSMNISGMTCGSCVRSVTRALQQVEGVTIEQVTVGAASVSYDSATTSAERIAEAVEREGYRVQAAA